MFDAVKKKNYNIFSSNGIMITGKFLLLLLYRQFLIYL